MRNTVQFSSLRIELYIRYFLLVFYDESCSRQSCVLLFLKASSWTAGEKLVPLTGQEAVCGEERQRAEAEETACCPRCTVTLGELGLVSYFSVL